jgi:hypothetical protein
MEQCRRWDRWGNFQRPGFAREEFYFPLFRRTTNSSAAGPQVQQG